MTRPAIIAIITALLALTVSGGAVTVNANPAQPVSQQSAAASTVWSVQGWDARGVYTGQVELIPDAGGYRFIRVIDYDASVKVEDERTLSWVWQGRAVPDSQGALNLLVNLQKADFIRRRGDLVRTLADQLPVVVIGRFNPANGVMQGVFNGPGIGASETWSLPSAGGERPIFATQVTETPTHNAIPKSTRDFMFRTFASYQALPEVKPYVNRPEFKNPIHTVISDKTDFDFFQQHPDRLRVVDKVIDAISLQETLARADAYRKTLAEKADFHDRDTAEKTIDRDTGMLFAGLDNAGKGYPSHDSALWTGAYVASQYYRYQATGEPAALANIARSADALLTLLEIPGDQPANRQIFARTLRKAQGNPSHPWYPGTGRFAHLEWEAGGNNDMFKGVMFGLTVAQAALCDQPTPYAALCPRIQRDSTQAALYVKEAQPSGYNRLAALWLTAYSTRNPVAVNEARKEWGRQASQLGNGSNLTYVNGITDWSGTHLAAVQYLLFNLLTERYPLPGIESRPVLKRGIENIYQQFARIPMGLWSVAFAKLGVIPHANAAQDALWRLREAPTPKTQLDIDHRISADFVMSPFPAAPWKNDWTRTDRTQSLRAYPLFEGTAYTVYDWSQSPLTYAQNTTGANLPGADYLLAYWLGRSTGVFAPLD